MQNRWVITNGVKAPLLEHEKIMDDIRKYRMKAIGMKEKNKNIQEFGMGAVIELEKMCNLYCKLSEKC